MSRKNLQKKIFNRLFFQFIRYLRYELADSICQTALHQKDADILISFRDTFYLFVTSYEELKNEDFQESIINIKSNINDYIGNKRTGHLELSLTEIPKNKLDFINLIDDSFKEFLSDYSNSCDDFKAIGRIKYEHIKRRFMKDKKGHKVLLQSLLEFNNAFSHLAVIFYNGEDLDGNMQKAKSHLYRGCLDNYKMLLRFVMPIINDSEIKQSFLKIREQEFLLLGKKIDNKSIEYACPLTNEKSQMALSKAYKELFNAAFSKIPKQYLKSSSTP